MWANMHVHTQPRLKKKKQFDTSVVLTEASGLVFEVWFNLTVCNLRTTYKYIDRLVNGVSLPVAS